MTLWDVNLWVYAFRPDSPYHGLCRESLIQSFESMEEFLFSPSVVSSFLRLVTNPRIFKQPSSISDAWAFVDWLEAHPASVFVESDAMTFGIFKHLCLASGAAGTAIPDAFLAAIALRHDASLKTMDSGMKRYIGVDVVLL